MPANGETLTLSLFLTGLFSPSGYIGVIHCIVCYSQAAEFIDTVAEIGRISGIKQAQDLVPIENCRDEGVVVGAMNYST